MRTNANATSESIDSSESIIQLGDLNRGHYRAAFTFRPNEHKVVTLGKERKKYHLYSRDDQQKIILNTLNFFEDRIHCVYDDVHFEQTDVVEMRLTHVHCTFFVPMERLKEFINHCDLIDKRYSVPKYKAVHHFPVNDDSCYQKWCKYISKIIHAQSVWTAGI